MAVSCEQQPSRVGEQPVVAERTQALQKFGIGGRREPAGRFVAGFPEVFPGQLQGLGTHQLLAGAG